MAKNKKNSAKEKNKADKSKKLGKGFSPFFLILLLILALAGLPVSMILFCGMLPTFIMMFTDGGKEKHRSVAVGAMNFVGTAHIILQMFKHGMGVDYAIQLLTQPLNWVVMWGGAAIGIALFTLIPSVVAQFLMLIAELKIQKLKTNLVELKKNWGDEVAGK